MYATTITSHALLISILLVESKQEAGKVKSGTIKQKNFHGKLWVKFCNLIKNYSFE